MVDWDRRAKPHFDWAQQQILLHTKDCLVPLDELFAQGREGTPSFAEDALGWSSKWRLMVDYVPCTRHDRHATFLRGQFASRIFTAEQLTDAIEKSVRSYLAMTEDVENQMLVRMRLDMATLARGRVPVLESDAKFKEAMTRAIEQIRPRVEKELAADGGTLVASEVAFQVASRIAIQVLEAVATRLGISGGILAAGAESGPWTVGVGMVAAIIVDWIVSKIWDWCADPHGKLVALMQNELKCLQREILHGTPEHPGLNNALAKIGQHRDALRRAAVLEILKTGQ